MTIYYYYSGEWWDSDNLTKEKKRKKVENPPERPPLRPGWWLEIKDHSLKVAEADFETVVGKCKQVILNTETGEFTYTVHVAWARFDVSTSNVVARMVKSEA